MWEIFIEKIQIVIDQIKNYKGHDSDVSEFNSADYKIKLGAVLKALGHEATKVSLVFSKPPLPPDKECESLLMSVEKTAVALMSVYCKLPKTAGTTLRKAVKSAVQESLENIKGLIEIVKNGGAGSPDQLQSTGLVWEETDKHLTLPKDNCEAACQVILKNCRLIDDAHMELTEALNCDEDDEEDLNDFLGISETSEEKEYKWSEADRTIVQFCLGLMKCSKNIVKKCRTPLENHGHCDIAEKVVQIDTLVDGIERLSPIVDELATCVYPPLRLSVVEQRAADLKERNKDLLDFLKCCHFTTEDDQKWIEFLKRANLHNYSKIQSLILNT